MLETTNTPAVDNTSDNATASIPATATKTKKPKDWTKKSNVAIRAAMDYYRLNPEIPLPPELDAEAARRFPQYDRAARKITWDGNATDWTKKSDGAIRTAITRYRCVYSSPFPSSLDAEAAKRFPNYDPKTHKFIGHTTESTDWTKSSDHSLRMAVAYYVKRPKIQFPPKLNAEAARRFPYYDPKTHTFAKRPRDWSKLLDESLRAAIGRYRRQKDWPFPPELDAEAARRFPNYDTKTHRFRKPSTCTRTQDWDQASYETIYAAVARYNSHPERPFPPELNDAAARRFPTYNPKTHSFPKRTDDMSKRSDKSIRASIQYYRRHRNGNVPPELDAEAARRFPNYDIKTHTFLRDTTGVSGPSGSASRETTTHRQKAANADASPKRDARKSSVVTRWRKPYARNAKRNNPRKSFYAPSTEQISYGSDDNILMSSADDFDPYKFMKTTQSPVAKPATPTIVADDKKRLLKVSVVTVKSDTDNLTYNNIVVNGRVILSHHLNTRVQTFLGGAYLGIHGVWTGNAEWANTPHWIFYSANMNQVPALCQQPDIHGKLPVVSNVSVQPDVVKLTLSTRAVVELNAKKKFTGIFEIKTEKSR